MHAGACWYIITLWDNFIAETGAFSDVSAIFTHSTKNKHKINGKNFRRLGGLQITDQIFFKILIQFLLL